MTGLSSIVDERTANNNLVSEGSVLLRREDRQGKFYKFMQLLPKLTASGAACLSHLYSVLLLPILSGQMSNI